MRKASSRVSLDEHDVECAGTTTHVLEAGAGDPPLVLLHGVLSNGASWAHVMPGLATARRVIAPDLPLHGRTLSPPTMDVGPDGLTGWLGALLDAERSQVADLCGLSMGGAVAAHFAARHPARVRRLVLVDAANVVALAEPYAGLLQEVRVKVEAAAQGRAAATAGEDRGSAVAEMPSDPIISALLVYVEGQGIPLAQLASGLRLLEPLGRDALSRIEAPTLAIWGAEDPYFPAGPAADALRQGLRRGRVEVLDGVGHSPVHERPKEFMRLLEGYLAP
jgi:pimeloyl-ACP methyl ester carboxylesterase